MLDTKIKTDFLQVLASYSDISDPIFDFSNYENNKKDFYANFGNNLIVSKPVVIKTDDSAKQRIFDDFTSYIYIRRDLHDFIKANGIDGFFANEVNQRYQIQTDNGLITIPAGMKLSRSFKLFIDDSWSLNFAQTKYSQAINNDGLSGQLCLSIHPFDYLSISQNNNGWRSCQSLDGEFAAGTLSLMNDKVTVVAYLSNGEDYPIFSSINQERMPKWNSKKWRVLVHIDKTRNRFMFSKHYPLLSPELENEVIEMIKSIYPNKNWNDKSEITASDKNDFIGNTKGRCNYNDITTGNNTYYQLTTTEQSDKILVGNTVACLTCGDSPITEPQYFACDDCGSDKAGYCCDDCGDCGILEDDMYYVERYNRSVCWHCFDNLYYTCDSCGDPVSTDEVSADEWVCPDCYDAAQAAKAFLIEEATNEQSRLNIQTEHSENN